MAHRLILTERQRNDLMALPTDESSMLTHYVLSDEDIIRIKQKRDDHNQLGFALQLCALLQIKNVGSNLEMCFIFVRWV